MYTATAAAENIVLATVPCVSTTYLRSSLVAATLRAGSLMFPARGTVAPALHLLVLLFGGVLYCW
jgi:hypothetical protein